MKLKLLFFIPLFSLFFSCTEDSTTVVLYVDNIGELGYVSTESKNIFKIVCMTENEYVENISISSFDKEYGTQQLMDTLVNKKNVKLDYEYTVPVFTEDSVKVQLSFKAVDNLGYEQTATYSVMVINPDVLLKEKSGLVVYSGKSEKENAFSLTDPSSTFNSELADSAKIDIYDYVLNGDNDDLDLIWKTNTDVDFIKVNSFNQVNATVKSIVGVYNSSKRNDYVNDIRSNDIIIVGKGGKPWGVFLIANVFDDDGIDNDRYLVNYKSLKQNNRKLPKMAY